MRQRYTITLDLETDEIPALALDTVQRAFDRAFPMARMETLRVLVCAPHGDGLGSTPVP